ncbi:hypothetical protein PIB30_078988 [Stylosanthes scabra]|uniref:Uncharacterized protein n=1 Tax=Stylosanthes scabra TaxID=79078 RepID=A0ABU6QQL0_9FABA|nr:hypothetical protein [Stylosanthes scabra]
MTSPYLSPSSLKQTWNKLDHASTSSKSQAKPTLQAPKFDPRFWGSKNVTLQKPMQASQALPSFKQDYYLIRSDALAGGVPKLRKDFGHQPPWQTVCRGQ